jgi:hypothetical protein
MSRKRFGVLGLRSIVVFSFLLTAVAAYAWPAAKPDANDPDVQRRAMIAEAQKTLNGTTWTVYTTLDQEGVKTPVEGTETLTFTDRRVNTKELAGMGYGEGGSNYSTGLEPDGSVMWETMQKYKDGEGEALMSGNLKDGVMTGVIDIQPAAKKGQRKIYHFTSRSANPAAEVTTGTVTTMEATPTDNTATTNAPVTKTKKEAKKGGIW